MEVMARYIVSHSLLIIQLYVDSFVKCRKWTELGVVLAKDFEIKAIKETGKQNSKKDAEIVAVEIKLVTYILIEQMFYTQTVKSD